MNSSPHHHFASFFDQEDLQPFAYAVSQQLAQGSVCLELKGKNTADLFDGFKEESYELNLHEALRKLGSLDELVQKVDPAQVEKLQKPFALSGDNFYITRYYNYETQIINGIRCLITKEKEALQEQRLSAFVQSVDAPVRDFTGWLQSQRRLLPAPRLHHRLSFNNKHCG